jgi:prepilin-type N-terminal cleavage/methylation domain-containing protein
MLMNMRKRLVGQPAGRDENRGFTLTEIAIVLGIVGLILGAIWVAAAAVYNNLRTSKATTELLTVVQNVRAMYATSGLVDANANMAVAATEGVGTAAATYLAAGVFPSDTLNNVDPSKATQAQDPWGGTISVESATSSGGVAADSFAVVFDRVPDNACIGILSSNVGQGRDPEMLAAVGGPAGAAPATLLTPAANFQTSNIVTKPASTAQSLCAGANNVNAVGFTFKVK